MSTVEDLVGAAYRENNLVPISQPQTDAETTEGLAVFNRYLDALFGHELGEQLYEWNVPDPQRTASVAARYPQGPAAYDLPSGVYPYPPANSRIMDKLTTAATVYFPEAPSDGARMAYASAGATAVMTLSGNGRRIGANTSLAARATITMTIAAPGVVTWTAHGRVAGDPVVFTTTGALATGVTAGTTYYVISAGLTANAFEFSDTPGGTAITTTGSQSGVHTGAIPDGTEWVYRADLGSWRVRRPLIASDDSPLPAMFDDLLICGTNIRLCPRHGKQPEAATVATYKTQLGKLQARYKQNVSWVGGAAELSGSEQTYSGFNPLGA